MEKETQKETLRRLFIENNLVQEDVFNKFYTIITRAGIDKIQAANNIDISYDLIYNSDDTKCVIIKATAKLGDKEIQTFGEAFQTTHQTLPCCYGREESYVKSCAKVGWFLSVRCISEDESDDFKR